jgi:hypothetical protein
MKAHIGVDAGTGMACGARATAANVHDLEVAPKLIRPDNDVVNGDAGYTVIVYRITGQFGIRMLRLPSRRYSLRGLPILISQMLADIGKQLRLPETRLPDRALPPIQIQRSTPPGIVTPVPVQLAADA